MNPTNRTDWANITSAGLEPCRVHSIVGAGAMMLTEEIWDQLDLAIVVLRGGALLERFLEQRSVKISRLRATRSDFGVRLTHFPQVDPASRRILICDVLCDTGSTLAECSRWAHEVAPRARIDLMCIYSTEIARTKLAASHRLHSAATFARPGWSAQSPHDIPYDFGDVAARCGLV